MIFLTGKVSCRDIRIATCMYVHLYVSSEKYEKTVLAMSNGFRCRYLLEKNVESFCSEFFDGVTKIRFESKRRKV
jgi:hypothetical protein